MRLIDADALIDEIKHTLWDWDSVDGIMSSTVLKQTISDINNMPTVDAEPVRHGKWIWEECVYKCSECSHKAYGNILECMDGTYKYCPNCGARLEIEENERKRANETNTTI